MGVLNVTPDSFSDGGRYRDPRAALARAREMVAEGAAVIDVGGESTRPGAQPPTPEEELRRVLPVVEALVAELPVPVSVDTSTPAVMRRACAAGAGLVNDVRALARPGALEAAAEAGAAVCLMHMRGEPSTMQEAPRYRDVVAEVCDDLSARMEACEAAGIPRGRILLDPGFGFGKTLAHNLSLLQGLGRVVGLGQPVLVGLSRKSMIGSLLDAPVDRRLYGSLAAAVLAVAAGARLVRVHDVRATVEALAVAGAVLQREA
jgi:dihydropteroate synthase